MRKPPLKKPQKPRRKKQLEVVDHFVREWRLHRDLTQDALAEAIGVTRGLISQYESGETGIPYVRLGALATALGCQKIELLSVNPLRDKTAIAITTLVRKGTSEEQAKILGYAQAIIGDRT